MAGQEELRGQIHQQDFKITELYSLVDDTPKKKASNRGSGILNNQQLDALEDRMTRRLADSVESLGEII
jgi:hypothetical protein